MLDRDTEGNGLSQMVTKRSYFVSGRVSTSCRKLRGFSLQVLGNATKEVSGKKGKHTGSLCRLSN